MGALISILRGTATKPREPPNLGIPCVLICKLGVQKHARKCMERVHEVPGPTCCLYSVLSFILGLGGSSTPYLEIGGSSHLIPHTPQPAVPSSGAPRPPTRGKVKGHRGRSGAATRLLTLRVRDHQGPSPAGSFLGNSLPHKLFLGQRDQHLPRGASLPSSRTGARSPALTGRPSRPRRQVFARFSRPKGPPSALGSTGQL